MPGAHHTATHACNRLYPVCACIPQDSVTSVCPCMLAGGHVGCLQVTPHPPTDAQGVRLLQRFYEMKGVVERLLPCSRIAQRVLLGEPRSLTVGFVVRALTEGFTMDVNTSDGLHEGGEAVDGSGGTATDSPYFVSRQITDRGVLLRTVDVCLNRVIDSSEDGDGCHSEILACLTLGDAWQESDLREADFVCNLLEHGWVSIAPLECTLLNMVRLSQPDFDIESSMATYWLVPVIYIHTANFLLSLFRSWRTRTVGGSCRQPT